MRITRLDLLRYGKFTDKSVSLPKADRDFHMIVGPNEAGKSTLQNAIQDLLFGIDTRSRYGFMHTLSEMRLGALIEDGDSHLDFIRTKARSKTLVTVAGLQLPDDALSSFVGQIDRSFFDQMFGLNHERLTKGGEEILSASNDIGQILFQAAAGIGSLGDIRDKLEAEATQLWAKRKSGEREYYIASTELEQAEAALKQATVRTKDWQEAHNLVEGKQDELKQLRENYQALEQERVQLERVRRVAALLTSLTELEGSLTELGEVVALPESAANELANSEKEIAIASALLSSFNSKIATLQADVEKLHPNASILARATDIEALSEQRQQLRNHESDIGKREEEIKVLWQEVVEATRELAWPIATEAEVTQHLPSSLVRSAIDSLVRRYEPLTQALSTSEESLRIRQEEIKSIGIEILELPATEISMLLVDALSRARSLGDVAAQDKNTEVQVLRLQRELDNKTLDLGAWNPALDVLKKLLPPTTEEMNDLIKRRGDLESAAWVLNESMVKNTAEAKSLQLEIAQYKAAHQPVTMADVQQARTTRDSAWRAIKNGVASLKEAALGYEKGVVDADSLSDKRHDKAKEETELQSCIDRLQRLQLQTADQESRKQDNAQALNTFDTSWADRIKVLGLNGMNLLQVNGWRLAREQVLSVNDALAEAQLSREVLIKNADSAKAALMDAMLGALLAIKPSGTSELQQLNLSALILQADAVVTSATRSQERCNFLTTQKLRTESAIQDLSSRAVQAQADMTMWQADLNKNLALAYLPTDTDVGSIDAALRLFEGISLNLQKIRETRANRIDMMHRDLNDFTNAAKALAADIAPELIQTSATQIVLALANSLKQEAVWSEDLARLETDLQITAGEVNATKARIDEAQAGLEPLLRLCGVGDNDGLRLAIGSSDRIRLLTVGIDQIQKQLLQAGDGLNREALKAEFEANDAMHISMRLPEIKRLVDDGVQQQNRLSGELNAAEQALNKIAGQDEAARAESQRQEALARMANAAERYVKVYTAVKLLRWSIDRFRENKQGPMLIRASEVFIGLTKGAFTKLVVDYESEPLKLSGQRVTGEFVDIDGMSEGTRDQLYLALRLAALELHLEQTTPLPFIADDLFINYDDGRSKAGLEALAKLSESTQVVFLTHHDHLVSVAQEVFGNKVNLVHLS